VPAVRAEFVTPFDNFADSPTRFAFSRTSWLARATAGDDPDLCSAHLYKMGTSISLYIYHGRRVRHLRESQSFRAFSPSVYMPLDTNIVAMYGNDIAFPRASARKIPQCLQFTSGQAL
jgi:hypothetical protein